MNKHQFARCFSLLLIAVMLLTCTVPAGYAETQKTGEQKHTIEEKRYETYLCSPEDKLTKPYPLFFIDGVNDLPYVELKEWAELLYVANTELNSDTGYDLYIDCNGDLVTFERENEYTLDFDFQEGKMVFSDYDAFVHKATDTTLIDLVTEPGYDAEGNMQLIMRDKEASFDRYGDMLTVDLAGNGIPMIRQEDKYYVPLQTMNDFLMLPLQHAFLFNGEALFLANDEKLFSYRDGDYTELAELYYSAPTGERSDALAEYSYNELCLVLDTFYGLKEQHDIHSFRELFWQIGYDEVLTGNSAEDADRALKSVIDYYLDDLHSVFNEYSYLAGLLPIPSSTGIANRKLTEHQDAYSKARKAFYPDGCPGYEEIGNTAYITFDTFTSNFFGEAFYNGKEKGEIPDDTIGLIIHAHEQITRENSPIENVVLDLSNNTGGAVDAAVFVLGWLLGEAPFSVKNTATGAMSTSIYRSDVNLDRVFDEEDTVADKNLYCLISPVSFSCGNLVPAALKSSQKVTLLGKTSGGGSCVVQNMSTAYGTVFQMSSALRMSFLKNGSFYDIDQGVEPDYYINSLSNYYNRTTLTQFINNLY